VRLQCVNFTPIFLEMIFSSKLIEDAVQEFSRLPGIGRKTALRMVLHLLKMDKDTVNNMVVLPIS
jgi:recombination protein RecR